MISSSENKASFAEGLRAQNLRKSYTRRVVVGDVNLHVKRGEAVGLLGPNGAGKTTCFAIITGLIKADSGSVFLDNYDITRLPMYRRARLGIGYLPQETSIFRGLSVENNIKAILELVEPDYDQREERLEMLLLLPYRAEKGDAPKLRAHSPVTLTLCCWMSP